VVQSERFFVQTVILFNLVERVLLKRAFDAVQDIIYMMLVWTPRIELGSKVEGSILMRNEWMKDIGDEVHCWGSFGVVVRKRQTKP